MIKVLFFGATADIVGKRQIDLLYEAPTSIDKVHDRLFREFPALRKRGLLTAVNQEYVPHGAFLKDGDEVAIFSAVSGG